MRYALDGQSPRLRGEGHYIAPGAVLIGNVELGPEASVWFTAVLRGDNDGIRVGAQSNVQDGAILHTDPGIELEVGDRVTIGHRAMLHGCRIGDGSLIGIGSTILNGARIGSCCVVGAHSLVTEGKSFPDGVLVLGAPARVVRELDAGELAEIDRAAEVYVSKARRYRDGLQPADNSGR